MMPTVDKLKQKLWLIIFFLCLLNLVIFPTAVYAWSDPGLGPGVVQGTQVTISGGDFGGTLKYNTLYEVRVNGSQVGSAVLINQIPSYGGYAFIPSSALSEAVSAFKGNYSHVSGNVNLYTINPNNNKRYWIREVGYHSGADVIYSGKVVNITPSPLPTGNISTPPTIKAGQPVNISLTATSLTLSGISVFYDKYKLDYKFKINGSQVDSGTASKNLSKQVNYTFPSPGTYTLKLELEDAFKRKDPKTNGPVTIEKTVTVIAGSGGPPPVPPSGGKPLADFDLPSMTTPNTSVTVTDRSQAYGGATITTRTWTITPSGYSGTPAGTSYSVSFPSEGTYTVKLVVKDSKGNTSDPCEKTIIVQGDFIPPDPPEPPNGPPVAKMKYPKAVGIGKPAQIENLSYDTDGSIVDVDWDIDPQEGRVAAVLTTVPWRMKAVPLSLRKRGNMKSL
ncbi:hypothetical protein P378_05105 [Desulforamulus profundi]|uniref:PKD/Chitinase domain-containing protein n=1 Tax=Desulforamulus profundi TaxID=1383067 RepID=A0A2C6MHA9_9FIRM|nr:PKD domain-containing protein [Desulforamulus profundi]PHJ39152.1 hypothetical protein P378_05105 [Desulforamulus profundi]